MNRSILFIIIFFVPFLFTAQSIGIHSVPDDEEDPFFILSGEADKAISQGDYPSAIMRINEALAIDPDNPTNVLLLSNLGILHNFMNEDSLALDAFNRANLIAPSMTVVLVNRGKLHLKMGNDNDAFEDFGKVLARDSTNTDALFYHGIMALYSGLQKEAEQDFMRLESLAPGKRNTLIALSSLYSMTGRDARAVPYLEELVKVDPQPEYYANLAGCNIALGNLSDASAVLSEGLGKFPDDPEIFLYRAWLNKKRYLMKDSREDAAKAIVLGADPRKVERLLNE